MSAHMNSFSFFQSFGHKDHGGADDEKDAEVDEYVHIAQYHCLLVYGGVDGFQGGVVGCVEGIAFELEKAIELLKPFLCGLIECGYV